MGQQTCLWILFLVPNPFDLLYSVNYYLLVGGYPRRYFCSPCGGAPSPPQNFASASRLPCLHPPPDRRENHHYYQYCLPARGCGPGIGHHRYNHPFLQGKTLLAPRFRRTPQGFLYRIKMGNYQAAVFLGQLEGRLAELRRLLSLPFLRPSRIRLHNLYSVC